MGVGSIDMLWKSLAAMVVDDGDTARSSWRGRLHRILQRKIGRRAWTQTERCVFMKCFLTISQAQLLFSRIVLRTHYVAQYIHRELPGMRIEVPSQSHHAMRQAFRPTRGPLKKWLRRVDGAGGLIYSWIPNAITSFLETDQNLSQML